MEAGIKERPILFSAPMVRALLGGRKTQTRRALNPPPDGGIQFSSFTSLGVLNGKGDNLICKFGKRGDRLWVKETFMLDSNGIIYRADGDFEGNAKILGGWLPSIFMPRAASRILLKVTDIRVEHLNDISESDAMAEGITPYELLCAQGYSPKAYRKLWESINGAGSWSLNPWVWVIEFKVIDPNVDAK